MYWRPSSRICNGGILPPRANPKKSVAGCPRYLGPDEGTMGTPLIFGGVVANRIENFYAGAILYFLVSVKRRSGVPTCDVRIPEVTLA